MKPLGITDRGFSRLAQSYADKVALKRQADDLDSIDKEDRKPYVVYVVRIDKDGGETPLTLAEFPPGQESAAIDVFYDLAKKYNYGKWQGYSYVEVSLRTDPVDEVLMWTENGQVHDPNNFRYESGTWDMPSLNKSGFKEKKRI